MSLSPVYPQSITSPTPGLVAGEAFSADEVYRTKLLPVSYMGSSPGPNANLSPALALARTLTLINVHRLKVLEP